MLAYFEGLPHPVPSQPEPYLLLLLFAVDERADSQIRGDLRKW